MREGHYPSGGDGFRLFLGPDEKDEPGKGVFHPAFGIRLYFLGERRVFFQNLGGIIEKKADIQSHTY